VAKRKKSRTPAPPRRPAAPKSDGRARQVQAPQVRTKRRGQQDVERRNRIILYSVAGAGILGLAIALIVVFAIGRGGGHGVCSAKSCPDDGPSVNFATLPGVLETPPPWKANTANLDRRLKAMGLPPLQQQEGTFFHIHQHLDIFVNGKHVTVPQFIGIRVKGNSAEFAELHTHDTRGVMHVESFRAQAVSLGQFFGVWGVRLAKNCIGSLCHPPQPFKIYVNGDLFNGDPVKLVLQAHQEIAIVYGTPPDSIPSSFDFQQGE
jgi:hypothetical protein